MRYLFLFATVIWALIGSLAHADGESLRPTYGGSIYPIWSELSYFENDTLAAKSRAEQNDPKALLAFYVMASGARNLTDYENTQRRVSAFVEGAQQQFGGDQDPWRRADALHQAMHSEFFVSPGERHGGNGYDADQSQLTGIFANGQFNCISASLLYVVLAREFKFGAQGVLLPSHAFVELALPDGRSAEVETTNPQGFGTVHNQAFYEKAAAWFKERGLRASTIEDYRNRKKVSPLALGAMNMLNQHTRKERMSFADAARLAEISAYLDPSNALAQEKRLHFYLQEVDNLSQANAWPDLQRLYNTVLFDVRQTSDQFPEHQAIQNSNVWLHLSALYTYGHLANSTGMISLMKIINRLPLNAAQQQKAQDAFASSSALLLQQLGEKQQFEEGLVFISEAEPYLTQNAAWPANVTLFYNLWAGARWQHQDWPGVVDVLDEYFAQPYQEARDTTTLKNLRGAYRNWVVNYLELKDTAAAKTVLESCQQKFPELKACEGAADALKAGRN